MTLPDAITWMQQRPGFCAALPGGPIIGLSASGYLMRQDKVAKTYWRPHVQHCLAITWEVFTVEQLEAAAEAARLQASAATGVSNGTE